MSVLKNKISQLKKTNKPKSYSFRQFQKDNQAMDKNSSKAKMKRMFINSFIDKDNTSLSNASEIFKATYHDALNEEYSGGSLLLNSLKRVRE